MSYIQRNREYYSTVYDPKFVETIIVRSFHKYMRSLLDDGAKLLDFGCGTGTPTGFFKSQGLNIHGVDFSAEEIDVAKIKFPDIANHFAVCDGTPRIDDRFFGGDFDFIFAMQALYYMTDTDTEIRFRSLHSMMKPGALIWASMMASDHNWFARSTPAEDGLRRVPSGEGAIPAELGHHYINFTNDTDHLKRKFGMFDPIFVGYYDHDIGEGSTKHWLFIGHKPK